MDGKERARWMEKIDQLKNKENWTYVEFLCKEMLYYEPNYVDARAILHASRLKHDPLPKLKRWIKSACIFIKGLMYAANIKTKHRQLLECLDLLLEVDPKNVYFLRIFAEVMSGFGFYESAIFFVQCIPDDQRNPDDWLLIGESYLGCDNFPEAMSMANRVLEKFPDNIRARDLLWKSSVEQSIGGGQ